MRLGDTSAVLIGYIQKHLPRGRLKFIPDNRPNVYYRTLSSQLVVIEGGKIHQDPKLLFERWQRVCWNDPRFPATQFGTIIRKGSTRATVLYKGQKLDRTDLEDRQRTGNRVYVPYTQLKAVEEQQEVWHPEEESKKDAPTSWVVSFRVLDVYHGRTSSFKNKRVEVETKEEALEIGRAYYKLWRMKTFGIPDNPDMIRLQNLFTNESIKLKAKRSKHVDAQRGWAESWDRL